MSSDICGKSWVELCEEDEELEYQASTEVNKEDIKLGTESVHKKDEDEDVDMKKEEETVPHKYSANNSSTEHKTTEENTATVIEQECEDSPDSKSDISSKTLTPKDICKESDEKVIANFIKTENENSVDKVPEELLEKYIKHEKDEGSNDDLDDMYLFMEQPAKVSADKSEAQEVKIKSEPKTELKTELHIEGGEDEWAVLAGCQDKAPSSKRLTFAQICAKNASPSTVVQTVCSDKSMGIVSPAKQTRKRSLFPENSCDAKKEVFGILDENSVDSPSKDIRRIMNNIHMDSPLGKESENVRRSPRKIAIPRRQELADVVDSSTTTLRKRTRDRDSSKGSGSPVSKMAHYSNSSKTSADGEDSPVRKSKGFETDKAILSRRQKQIDYGKNTKGYDNYIKMVPKDKREPHHPKTPPKHLVYSRRAWDGLIKVWRQKLHFWDHASEGGSGGISLPDSWDSLSEGSFSLSNSDDMSEKSLPTTPKGERKKARKSSNNSSETVSQEGD